MNRIFLARILTVFLIATAGYAPISPVQTVRAAEPADMPPGMLTREELEAKRREMQAEASADETKAHPAAEARAPAKDFGSGFEMFHKLGLPRVASDARYIALNAYGENMYVHPGRNISGMWGLELKGNAWVIEELPDGVVRVLLYNGQTVAVGPHRSHDAEGTDEEKAEPARIWIQGQWEDADPAQDLTAILAFLEERKSESRSRRYGADGSGELFLAMASFYATGHAENANRAVQSLFESERDPRQVVAMGMNRLADSLYEETYAAFRQHRDWQAFDQALTDLLGRFKTGWENAPAVALLVRRVRARKDDAPTKVAGLSEADQALADALLSVPAEPSATAGYRQRRSTLWILGRDQAMTPDAPPHPLHRILDQGMASVPLLIALLGDTTLTPLDRSDMAGLSGSHRYSYSHSSHTRSGGPLTEEIVRQRYSRLARPLTRGEIARNCLDPLLIVPGQDRRGSHSRRTLDDEDFKVEIEVWHDAHKAATPKAIARAYLRNGDQSQSMVALTMLVESDDEEDMAIIEDYFVEQIGETHGHGSPHRHIEDYVFRRGKAAEAFVQRYAEAWTAKTTGKPDAEEDAEHEALFRQQEAMSEQMDRHLRNLRLLAEAASADKLLADLLAGPEDATQVLSLLHRHLGKMSLDDGLPLLLPPLAATRDAAKSETLFGLLNMMARGAMHGRMPGMEDEDEDEAPAPITAQAHADLWRPLLDDETTRVQAGSLRNWRVAEMMEMLYNPMEYYELHAPLTALWGDRRQSIMLARARARIDGVAPDELPVIPRAEAMEDDARAAWTQRLMDADSEALLAMLSELTPAKELALSALIASDSALNRRMQAVTLAIRAVSVAEAPAAMAERAAAFQGRTWDRKLFEDLNGWAQALAAEGHALRLSLRKPIGVVGLTLHATPVRDARRTHPFETLKPPRPAAVRARLQAGGGILQVDWRDGAETTAPAETPVADEPLDLLDMLADELENDMERRVRQQQSLYWDAVTQHPAETWRADSVLEAVWETYPIEE